MKKNYLKPSMQVINLKQRPALLYASGTDDPNKQSEEQDSEPAGYNDIFA